MCAWGTKCHGWIHITGFVWSEVVLPHFLYFTMTNTYTVNIIQNRPSQNQGPGFNSPVLWYLAHLAYHWLGFSTHQRASGFLYLIISMIMIMKMRMMMMMYIMWHKSSISPYSGPLYVNLVPVSDVEVNPSQWFLTVLEVLNPASYISAFTKSFVIGKIKYDFFSLKNRYIFY